VRVEEKRRRQEIEKCWVEALWFGRLDDCWLGLVLILGSIYCGWLIEEFDPARKKSCFQS
jgi:hypothetical protein